MDKDKAQETSQKSEKKEKKPSPLKGLNRSDHYSLSHQQRMFADWYLKGCSGAEAARKAGYSAHTSDRQAHRLLSNSKVKGYVEAKKQEIYAAIRLDEGDIHRIWKEIADNSKSNNSDRLRATELIAKTIGMFKDKDNSQPNIFQIFTDKDIQMIKQFDAKEAKH